MHNPSPIGIIGLGQIGSGMAARLAGLGHPVAGFDISPEASGRAASMGVHIAGNVAELAERCETILTSLSSVSAIEKTYLGPGGLAFVRRPGLLTLECSTIPVEVARRITAAMLNSGAMAIEASVIGQNREAKAGNLFFVVSGDAHSVAHAQTVLGLLGHGQVHIGPSGTAAAAKLINNAIGAVTICAIAEAIALASDLGIDPQAFVRLVDEGKGAGSSVVFERHASHMANWRDSQRPPGPIALKDAQGLAALMGNRRAVLPFLAEMVAQYEAVLPNAAHPQAETVTEHAVRRLAALTSQQGEAA